MRINVVMRKAKNFVPWLRNKIRVKCRFYWMAKQMKLIDPAEDKRPKYWKKCGVDVQGKFKVGYGVYFDAGNAEHIHIDDGVWIASQCLFLCHRRIIDDYKVGDDYNALHYKVEDIHLEKGCCIGMQSTVMPGVTIGEGSIIGVGSLVTKDIPAWSIAVGRPAKVVKQLLNRNKTEEETAS